MFKLVDNLNFSVKITRSTLIRLIKHKWWLNYSNSILLKIKTYLTINLLYCVHVCLSISMHSTCVWVPVEVIVSQGTSAMNSYKAWDLGVGRQMDLCKIRKSFQTQRHLWSHFLLCTLIFHNWWYFLISPAWIKTNDNNFSSLEDIFLM